MQPHTSSTTQPPPPPPPPVSDSPTIPPPNDSTAPPHSDHIELSPPRSSDSSIAISSPENETPQSFHSHETTAPRSPPPQPVVQKSVSQEPKSVVNRTVLDEPTHVVSDTSDGGARRRFKPSLSILKRGKREKMVKRAAVGFRVLGFLFCLASFAVMAADRNQGWAVDSFERYREFRYCMSVNVIGFVYSGAQGLDLVYTLATGKSTVQRQQKFRHYFDFAVDQMIAYLLISASSSAATRIDDWKSNWGKDKFPDMATASVSTSFLAFVAIASSSLISGYAVYTSKYL